MVTMSRQELNASPNLDDYLKNFEELDAMLDLPPTTVLEMASDAATNTSNALLAEDDNKPSPEKNDRDSPDSDKSWRLSNAVHMQLQDNAKLPSFLLPVNRQGSSIVTTAVSKHEDASEFLESKRHYDYAENEPTPAKRRKTNNDDTVSADASIPDPTPLSELQRRFRAEPLPIPTNATAAEAATTTVAVVAAKPAPALKTPKVLANAATQQSKYGFGRKHRVPSVPKQDAAYERKKQRAKDARVRLNESIDRLAIAMSVSSQQASLRQKKGGNWNPATQRALVECVKIADSAKKFDRPSFVGTAADLVQGLNAQCEALAREVYQLRRQQQSVGAIVDSKAAPKVPRTATTTTKCPADTKQLFGNPKIIACIQSFLDPLSLARSSRVARSWSRPESAWGALALTRFGIVSVRSLGDQNPTGSQLYQTLAATPPPPSVCSSGSVLLGQASLPHVLHCWVYLRERSNGETLRSVQVADGVYQGVPVVELQIILQSLCADNTVILPEQSIAVDASTRRRAVTFRAPPHTPMAQHQQLRLWDTVRIPHVYVQCDGCSTVASFIQRSNYTTILVQRSNVTLPVVVPFPRDVTELASS